MAHRNFAPLQTLTRGLVVLPINFSCASDTAPVLDTDVTAKPCTVSRVSAGVYKVSLGASTSIPDTYRSLLAAQVTVEKTTANLLTAQINTYDVTTATPSVTIGTYLSDTATDLTGTIHCTLWLKASSAK